MSACNIPTTLGYNINLTMWCWRLVCLRPFHSSYSKHQSSSHQWHTSEQSLGQCVWRFWTSSWTLNGSKQFAVIINRLVLSLFIAFMMRLTFYVQFDWTKITGLTPLIPIDKKKKGSDCRLRESSGVKVPILH